MLQAVKRQLPSPLQRGQSVLTLACGHLWSWNSSEPAPAEVDCIHCDKGRDCAGKILCFREALRRGYSVVDPEPVRKVGDSIELRRPPRHYRGPGWLIWREASLIMVTLRNETELALYNQKP